MTIAGCRVQVDGTWHSLSFNSGSGRWEGTVTAPGTTSYHQVGGYYPLTLEARAEAGATAAFDDTDPAWGASLRLVVKEITPPTITITHPGSGAYVSDVWQPASFLLEDGAEGSGVDLASLEVTVDGQETDPGEVGVTVTESGFDCVYTPSRPWENGPHTVTVRVADHDGNRSLAVSRGFTVDTVPPSLDVTSPAADLLTNQPVLTVAGTASDDSGAVTVILAVNGGEGEDLPVTGGAFSHSLTLAEGLNLLVLTAQDQAGHTTRITRAVTLDTRKPRVGSVSLHPNPADDGATLVLTVEVS